MHVGASHATSHMQAHPAVIGSLKRTNTTTTRATTDTTSYVLNLMTANCQQQPHSYMQDNRVQELCEPVLCC